MRPEDNTLKFQKMSCRRWQSLWEKSSVQTEARGSHFTGCLETLSNKMCGIHSGAGQKWSQESDFRPDGEEHLVPYEGTGDLFLYCVSVNICGMESAEVLSLLGWCSCLQTGGKNTNSPSCNNDREDGNVQFMFNLTLGTQLLLKDFKQDPQSLLFPNGSVTVLLHLKLHDGSVPTNSFLST